MDHNSKHAECHMMLVHYAWFHVRVCVPVPVHVLAFRDTHAYNDTYTNAHIHTAGIAS